MEHTDPSLVQPVRSVRFQSFHIVLALVLREAGARFGRSTGGYIWAFAEPIAGILLLSVAFSYLLRSPPIGDSFFLFYASGVVPLLFFNSVSGQLALAVAANRGLLVYPVVSVLDVIVARLLLETVTYFAVFGVIISAILYIEPIDLQSDLLVIFTGLAITALFGAAAGMVNCLLFLWFPVWRSIWRIITRPLLIISGVLFTYRDIPPEIREWLWFNPLLQAVGVVRDGLYISYEADYVSWVYLSVTCLSIITGSLVLIRLNESRLIQQ